MDKCRATDALQRSPSRFRSLLRMLVPSATVFFTGGCLMILVLAASRLVARSLGSSLYTWTSILGVVLAGISLGNYLGGRMADRYHARRALAVLFGLSSAACVGIVVTNNLADQSLWLWRLGWPSHVFLHVLFIFLLPSTLLGAVSPIVAKMALDQGLAAGRTVGSIYAWGAVGGIVGTFLTGFFLTVAFGNVAIIWLIGTALLLVAVLYWVSCWAMYLWGMVFIALATMGMANETWAQEAGTAALLRETPDPNVIYEAETLGGHMAVRRISTRPDTRVLVQDKLARGEMVENSATHLSSFHLKVCAGLARGLNGSKKNPSILVLGAGGYVLPRYLKTAWPNSLVEVIEIDSGVTKASREAFGLGPDTAIRIIHTDARGYVDQLARDGRRSKSPQRYDFVVEDVLDDYEVPFPLVTKEFNDQVAGLLTEDGVYAVHLLDTGRDGRLLGAVVNTARETFSHVYVITGPAESSSVVVAAKRELDPQALLAEQNKHLVFTVLDDSEIDRLKELCGGIVLTDDYAPVGNLLAPAVRRSATETLACKHLERAQTLQTAHEYEQSILWYRRALETDPSPAVTAYEQIGLMYLARNRQEDAAAAFRKAIEARANGAGRRTAIGAVHMQLGTLLARMDRVQEGKDELAKAVEEFRVELDEDPGAVATWERLGDTAAALGDFPSASEAFDKAVALEPRNPSHYQKLARALEFQRRYDEAVAAVRKHVALMKEQGRRDVVNQLNQYIDLLLYKKVKQANK